MYQYTEKSFSILQILDFSDITNSFVKFYRDREVISMSDVLSVEKKHHSPLVI